MIDLTTAFITMHCVVRWRERIGKPGDGIMAVRHALVDSEPLRRKELLRFLKWHKPWCRHQSAARLFEIYKTREKVGDFLLINRELQIIFSVRADLKGRNPVITTCLPVSMIRERHTQAMKPGGNL